MRRIIMEKRTYRFIVLWVVLGVLLAGCSDAKAKTDTVAKVDEKIPLKFWTFEDTETEAYIKRLALVPDTIDLEVTVIPNAQYEQKLRVATNGGGAPDAFMVDGPYIANYAYNGMLKSLDDYVDKAFWDDYVESSRQKCTFNNHIYALSQQETGLVLFYNKDHFAEAGITNIPASWDEAWTYDQLIDAAVKLTQRDASGNVVRFGINPTMNTPDMINEGMTFTLLNWLWNHGFEYVDSKYTTASGYLDSPQSITALNSYAELFNKKIAPLQSVEQGFETGKISMLVHNVSLIGGYETKFPELHFGVMPIPKGMKHYGTTGGWAYGVSSQSKDPANAYQILWALAGTEGHKIHVEWSKAMPSLKSLMELPMYTQDPRLVVALDTIRHARSRDIVPGYAEISPIINELCNSVAYGEKPENLVKSAVAKINRIISKYPALN
jgi:fructooligosaccharide transport system substrate-binding protein